MSFLPYSGADNPVWWGSIVLSSVTHVGLGAALFVTGSFVLSAPPADIDTADDQFAVTLEILDAEIIEEVQPPIDDIPEDAEELLPEADVATLEAEDAALTPEDSALAPEEPAVEELAALEPEPAEPEVLAPEALEPEVVEPEVVEPEPAEPEVVEPELAEAAPIEPEPVEPEPVEPEIVEDEPLLIPDVIDEVPAEPVEIAEAPEPQIIDPEPVPPAPAEPEGLDIADLSVIEEEVLNPLAGGGGNEPEPEVLTDDTLAALDVPLDAPEPVAPEPVEPEVVEPEVVAEPETPEAPEEDALAALDLPDDTPPVATEEAAEEEIVPEAPAAPALQRVANPSASDIAIGALIRRIRATPQVQCTLALPRRASTGAGLSLIGADEAVLDDLAARITDGLDATTAQSREVIDARQCATLDILRRADTYPATRIGLSLDATSYVSGDTLTGRVLGGEGLFLTLLLIDDNGVVQDLAPFTRLDGATPVFEAPIARAGSPRETRQIVLAIGTRGAPLDLGGRVGQLAQDVFAPLPSDATEAMVFGVATIDVR